VAGVIEELKLVPHLKTRQRDADGGEQHDASMSGCRRG
jgi:hypothetical protein